MIIYPRKGFTLIEILIVVAVIGIILAIALPNYLTSGTSSKKTVCVNNLKQIDAAIDQWAAENGISAGTEPTEDIYNYVKSGKPTCPSGGAYVLHAVGSKPQVNCSLEDQDHKLPE